MSSTAIWEVTQIIIIIWKLYLVENFQLNLSTLAHIIQWSTILRLLNFKKFLLPKFFHYVVSIFVYEA